uniref:Uncharacterized protein n=1 Tax=viral metagenome TaxID=1070528 RepID=A0A6C0EBL9_9ZZZZ
MNIYFPKIIDDILEQYFDSSQKNQIMTYFRIFYLLKVKTIYVDKNSPTKQQIKDTLMWALKRTKTKKVNIDIVKNNFNHHFDFFYKVFFIDDNVFFNTFFNNLLIHFLPYPYDYVLHVPLITYRPDVKYLYNTKPLQSLKLNTPMAFEKVKSAMFVNKKNVDIPENEVDVHVNLSYFDKKMFNDDCIYYAADDKNLYITDNELNIVYIRPIKEPNLDIHKAGLPYEILFPKWENTEGILNTTNIVYLSVHKKMKRNDLFNVFKSMDIKTSEVKYLYHNTTNEQIDLHKPTFFYLTPFVEMDDRRCMIVELKKDLDNILNFTESVVSSNPITNKKKEFDISKKNMISYDNISTINHYKNKPIEKKHNINYACVTSEFDNIDDFLKHRPYCDIGKKNIYSGRRKMHELIFKTRKYDQSKIYVYKHFHHIYKKHGYGLDRELSYYPQHHYVDMVYDNMLFDILTKLDISGFFFTDYADAFNKGGELVIVEPFKYADFYYISKDLKSCNSLKKLERNINRTSNSTYMIEMNNPKSFHDCIIIAHLLKKYNTTHDISIKVINCTKFQKSILDKMFDHICENEKCTHYTEVKVLPNKTYIKENIDTITEFKQYDFDAYDSFYSFEPDEYIVKNLKEIDENYSILPNFFELSGKVMSTVFYSLDAITLSNRKRIVGSRKKFVIDIDISNIVNATTSDLKKIINKLPNNIKFVYMTIGHHIDLKQYIEVSDDKIIIKNEQELLEKVQQLIPNNYDELVKLKDDKIGFAERLYTYNKIKIYADELDKLKEYKIDKIVAHYAIKFMNHYIYTDVAYTDEKYKDDSSIPNMSQLFTFYLKEYYYILGIIKSKLSIEEKNVINNLINNSYGMFKQLSVQLFYAEIMKTHKILNNYEITNYVDLLKTNLKKSIYDFNDNTSDINKIASDMYNWLNNEMKPYVLKYQ